MRNFKKDGYKDAGHDRNFKPAKSIPRPVKADFPHMTDYKEVKINKRDAEGAVIIEPRNFLTNPPKEGLVGKGTLLGGKIPYIEDPYDRKRELERKELEEHHAKL